MSMLVFDTETTGLLPKGKRLSQDTLELFPYVVQISWIFWDNLKNIIIKKKDFIIKLPPTITMCDKCIEIHGITNEKSQECGVDIKDVIDEFIQDVYEAKMIVAHNLDFDLNVLFAEIMRIINSGNPVSKYNINYAEFISNLLENKNLYCTMKESTSMCNIKMTSKNGRQFVKFPKLSELHEYLFQSTPKNLHNALNDVIVCMRCFYKMIFDTDILEKNEELNQLFSELL